METPYTIILPMLGQPNTLAFCLRGLVRNSRLKPKILVIWSRPEEWGLSSASDYLIDYDTLRRYKKYESVQQYIQERGQWCADNNIEFHDVTEASKEFRAEYAVSKYRDRPWQGGVDIAWKDHYGTALTKTKYVAENWDADFYPSPGWDEILINALEFYRTRYDRVIAVPSQMQPMYFAEDPHWEDPWKESPKIASARLTMPVWDKRRWSTEGNGDTFCAVYDSEFEDFVNKWGSNRVDEERPGIRDRLHHFPVMYDTEQFKNVIGGYSYMGSGYDVEIDNRCGAIGFQKISPRNSWIMHKGYIAVKPEEV